MVYSHANGTTVADTIAVAKAEVAKGYKAVRLQCGVPGVPNAYGIARGKLHYEPAEKGKPLEIPIEVIDSAVSTSFSQQRLMRTRCR